MFTKGQSAYVASSDSRQDGFECTIISIGKKYITVTDQYGRKWKFGNDDNHICEEWGIYSLHESEDEYKKSEKIKDMICYIHNRAYKLRRVLTDEEIENIYERLKDIEG